MRRLNKIIYRLNLLLDILSIITLKEHTKKILDDVCNDELDYMEHMINEI